jgi:hypothetical protein
MKGVRIRTLAISAVAAALLTAAAAAQAEEGPTRAEYVERVEPICQANTEANMRILKNVKERARSKQQRQVSRAGGQFIHASKAFEQAVDKLSEVPRPPPDEPRLLKWFDQLRIVGANLRKLGTALKEGDKILAAHEQIRVERAANASNNVGFVFEFHYCRLSQSRFT